MNKIEKFLNSGIYIALIFLITFISWTFYQDTPPYQFNLYNMLGVLFLVFIQTLILIFYKNTLYIIPIIVSILFIINKSDMTFDTAASLGFPIIALTLFLSGFIIHIIRFKPVFKKGIFFLGFFLIFLSYIIPLIYRPFMIQAIPVSFISLLYLLLYIFLSSTLKSNLNYLFKIMMFANILLTFEVFFYLYQGYLLNPELTFYYRIFAGWGRNLGWANINDMCFYIALTLPSYLYFIFKKPNNYLVWGLMTFPVIAVFLSKSRGGIIGFVIALGLIGILFLIKGNKRHIIQGIIFVSFLVVLFWLNKEAPIIWYEYLLDSLGDDLNDFSSNRLYIYAEGLKVFYRYPLFGGGWLSIYDFEFSGRIFMYHSTFIQALAAMGLFGLVALLIHYVQIFKFMFKNITFEKYLFLIGYLATQIHGLIDNVQYSVPYSVLIVIILALYETSERDSLFHTIHYRFHLNHE
jgi:O-antigen ligase